MVSIKKAYMDLGNAVVLTAVDNWRRAKKILKRNPLNGKAKEMVRECEEFFLSERFSLYTSIDGKRLLKDLNTEEEK